MYTFSYTVNTFDSTGYPVQRSGEIAATDEYDVIETLKERGEIDPHGYEFLDIIKGDEVLP